MFFSIYKMIIVIENSHTQVNKLHKNPCYVSRPNNFDIFIIELGFVSDLTDI